VGGRFIREKSFEAALPQGAKGEEQSALAPLPGHRNYGRNGPVSLGFQKRSSLVRPHSTGKLEAAISGCAGHNPLFGKVKE